MSKGSYHGFAPGERVHTDRIISVCEQRIRDGHIKATSIPEKQGYLVVIRDCGHDFLVWSPQSSHWGASPFNPNNWKSPEGQPITTSAA